MNLGPFFELLVLLLQLFCVLINPVTMTFVLKRVPRAVEPQSRRVNRDLVWVVSFRL